MTLLPGGSSIFLFLCIGQSAPISLLLAAVRCIGGLDRLEKSYCTVGAGTQLYFVILSMLESVFSVLSSIFSFHSCSSLATAGVGCDSKPRLRFAD